MVKEALAVTERDIPGQYADRDSLRSWDLLSLVVCIAAEHAGAEEWFSNPREKRSALALTCAPSPAGFQHLLIK